VAGMLGDYSSPTLSLALNYEHQTIGSGF